LYHTYSPRRFSYWSEFWKMYKFFIELNHWHLWQLEFRRLVMVGFRKTRIYRVYVGRRFVTKNTRVVIHLGTSNTGRCLTSEHVSDWGHPPNHTRPRRELLRLTISHYNTTVEHRLYTVTIIIILIVLCKIIGTLFSTLLIVPNSK